MCELFAGDYTCVDLWYETIFKQLPFLRHIVGRVCGRN